MMLHVTDHVRRSDTGRRRSGNEDSSYVRVPLFMIADGMGGAQAGEVASRLAVEAFAGGLPEGPEPVAERLATLITAANAEVHSASESSTEFAGMGTTCTAAYLGEQEIVIAHVGDSRCYRLRGGVFEQLTDDHSLVGELVRRGQLTDEEAESHPQRSIITRALGPEPDVEVDRFVVPAEDGDLYLICSDGLTDMLSDEEIAGVLGSPSTLAERADALVEAANRAGGRDNITVVLFTVGDVAFAAAPSGEQPTTETSAVRPVAAVSAPAPVVTAGDRRTRARAGVLAAVLVLAVAAVIASGLWIASRSVSFVGTNEEGFVTLYQGLPYDLPGLPLYQEQYVSGLPASEVPETRRELVTGHELRTQDDAIDLVRQLERGTVEPSAE